MQTNCEKLRTWSQLGAQDEKVRRSSTPRRDVRTPLCRAFGPKLPRRTGFNHAGGGTPAHCLRSARSAEAATNFERPFTPRTSLRSPRNFGNARFRRFANFDVLTPKKKNRKTIWILFSVFHDFRQIFEELGFF